MAGSKKKNRGQNRSKKKTKGDSGREKGTQRMLWMNNKKRKAGILLRPAEKGESSSARQDGGDNVSNVKPPVKGQNPQARVTEVQ